MTASSPVALVAPCLEKIQAGATARRFAKLRQDAKSLLDRLPELLVIEEPGSPASAAPPSPTVAPGAPPPGALADAHARELLLFLRDVLDAQRPALSEVALDLVQRLVAFRLVQGEVESLPGGTLAGGDDDASTAHGRPSADGGGEAGAAPPPSPPRPQLPSPASLAVELACRDEVAGDEAAELRALRALLTIATSASLRVRGAALLRVVRALVNVHLTTRSEVNAATARASLTQVVQAAFQRLEVAAAAATAAPAAPFAPGGGGGGAGGNPASQGPAAAGPAPAPTVSPASLGFGALRPDGAPGGALSRALAPPPQAPPGAAAFVQDFLADVVAGAADPWGGAAAAEVARGLDAAFDHSRPGDASPLAGPDGAGVSRAASLSEPGQAQASAAASAVAAAAAAALASSHSPASRVPRAALAARDPERTPEARDALLIFRALCRLSVRNAEGGGEAAAARGRLLALDLLDLVLRGAGPALASSSRFAAELRRSLCLSLLRAAKSPSRPVSRAAASIFVSLLSVFRGSLKPEIGVFYPLVLLRALEPSAAAAGAAAGGGPGAAASAAAASPGAASPASATTLPPPDAAARSLALAGLAVTSEDGQLLMDVFVNYDCDLHGADLFERTVAALARVAQGAGVEGGEHPAAAAAAAAAAPGEPDSAYAALHCLVALLEALTRWRIQVGSAAAGVGGAPAASAADGSPEAAGSPEAETAGRKESGARASAGAAPVAPAVPTAAPSPPGTPTGEERGARVDGDAEGALAPGPSPDGEAPRSGSPDLAADPAASAEAAWQAAAGAHAAPPSEEGPAAGDRGAPLSAPGPLSTGSVSADKLPEFLAFKRTFVDGVSLFNRKPTKGLAFFQSHSVVGRTPGEVAAFLRSTSALDKTALGDLLGELDNVPVLHAYIDLVDFRSLTFDEAIRKLLRGFRLPGEAQKIDRIMEKFASRYLECVPGSFSSAGAAYTLAYSVILLNTDAHNPGVKKKMSLEEFIRNNRGLNDGADFPREFLTDIYDRIVNDEIRMTDEPKPAAGAAGAQASAGGWFDALSGLLPGRRASALAEPSVDEVSRTLNALRERAAGGEFSPALDVRALRPALDVAWAPVLGALGVAFEARDDARGVALALDGFVAAFGLAADAGTALQRAAFLSSLARCASLHAPHAMRRKHAEAFRALLRIAERRGDALGDGWGDVLRAASRWELLSSAAAHAPTDAALFGRRAGGGAPATAASGAGGGGFFAGFGGGAAAGSASPAFLFGSAGPTGAGAGNPRTSTARHSINEVGLHFDSASLDAGHGLLVPPEVLATVPEEEVDRLFASSTRLDADGVVAFVRALCAVSREELRPGSSPRVFSLAKIVEVAAFNMGRIRLVWARIWEVLSDYFAEVGCHESAAVAMYGVDALRQLAMKFLERDELSNFSFQNDFLRPFCVVMRRSKAPEIRELVIRCVSQMVLARVKNVKSGWKSMFMVFTTAAGDASPQVVRLAFDTIERIVRDHFHHITELEATTFTDAVNCLVAYTNNPHSLDVALNALAFLRFCALQLAEGGLGDLSDVTADAGGGDAVAQAASRFRIRPAGGGEPWADGASGADGGAPPPPPSSSAPAAPAPAAPGRLSDEEVQEYFWFPLLAGLGELTFDPRPDVRTSALEILFDALSAHGAAFSPRFWSRVFDGVLFPMFDHVRAEVIDTTTFSDARRREASDAWLYDTCTRTLRHIVGLFVRFGPAVRPVLPRLLALLRSLATRPHAPLAGVGVAALVALVEQGRAALDQEAWTLLAASFGAVAEETRPDVAELVARRASANAAFAASEGAFGAAPGSPSSSPAASPSRSGSTSGAPGAPRAPAPSARPYSLGRGAGARRLGELTVRSQVQLLLVGACARAYAAGAADMPPSAAAAILDALRGISEHAASVDADLALRDSLLLAQAADDVPAGRALPDPPLLRLEAEASGAYLAALAHVLAASGAETRAATGAEARVVALCAANLDRFSHLESDAGAGELEDAGRAGANGNGTAPGPKAAGAPPPLASARGRAHEAAVLAPLVAATLRTLRGFPPDAFRAHVRDFYPRLAALIACEHSPHDVQLALADVFLEKVGPLIR